MKPKRAQKHKKMVSISKTGPASANGIQVTGIQGGQAPVDPASMTKTTLNNTVMKNKHQFDQ